MLYFKALTEGLSRAAAGRPRGARAPRRARRRRGLAGAARRARARRSGDGGAPRAHRRAAHPARARGLRAHRHAALRAAGRARRRDALGPCSRVALVPARPGAAARGDRASASTRCSPPGSSTSSRRLRARYALASVAAVDALRRLPAGVGVPRRAHRRGRRCARRASRRRASSRSGSSPGCASTPATTFDPEVPDLVDDVVSFVGQQAASDAWSGNRNGSKVIESEAATPNGVNAMFKLEVEDDRGIWSDVRGADGAVLTFENESDARAKLLELFPVLVKMEKYAGSESARASSGSSGRTRSGRRARRRADRRGRAIIRACRGRTRHGTSQPRCSRARSTTSSGTATSSAPRRTARRSSTSTATSCTR